MFPLGIVISLTHESPRSSTFEPWLSGLGMVGWKSAKLKVFHPVIMTLLQTLRQLGCISVRPEYQTPVVLLYASKANVHRTTKVPDDFARKKGKVRPKNKRTAPT